MQERIRKKLKAIAAEPHSALHSKPLTNVQGRTHESAIIASCLRSIRQPCTLRPSPHVVEPIEGLVDDRCEPGSKLSSRLQHLQKVSSKFLRKKYSSRTNCL